MAQVFILSEACDGAKASLASCLTQQIYCSVPMRVLIMTGDFCIQHGRSKIAGLSKHCLMQRP